MARIRFNTTGAIRIVTRSTREGIEDIMKEVLKQSNADVPILTTDLRSTGKLNHHNKSITITYETPYAAIQHENLSYNHPRGGKAKYLEDAFNTIVPGAVPPGGKLDRKVKGDLGGAK